MLVKVCGNTDLNFIDRIDELNIHFVGFIFYAQSKRFIDNKISAYQLQHIPNHIKKVGVFVNEEIGNILEMVKIYHLDFVQLHGDESPSYADQISAYIKVIKAFRIDEAFDFENLSGYESACTYFLFDTKDALYGGTGKKFNWQLLKHYKGRTPFLLSGGINPNDNAKIIGLQHPMFLGIDINSGFEVKPGVKDLNKIKIFLNQLT